MGSITIEYEATLKYFGCIISFFQCENKGPSSGTERCSNYLIDLLFFVILQLYQGFNMFQIRIEYGF